jgi:cystathionine gamma-synthase
MSAADDDAPGAPFGEAGSRSDAAEDPQLEVSAETFAAQMTGAIDPASGAVVPPIHPATTYARDEANVPVAAGRVYGRADNPTFELVESVVTRLEGGARTALFASGMAACTAVMLALPAGAQVFAPRLMYWALRGWLEGPGRTRHGLEVVFCDTHDPDRLAAALARPRRQGRARLLWLESPANPLWTVTDLRAAAAAGHAAGAVVAVDSTVATPVHTQPLRLGADLVVHAATKYLGGHSDVSAGTVTTARADLPLFADVLAVRAQHGAIAGPFEAWLLARGLRTLFVRVRAQSAAALELAQRLARHPAVAEVLYPGLPSFPGHAIAASQMHGGFGGMLSVRLRPARGDRHAAATSSDAGRRAALRTLGALRVWKRATSFGGTESLAEHRATVEGPTSPVPLDTLRLSVGLESVDDLWADLERGLAAAATV